MVNPEVKCLEMDDSIRIYIHKAEDEDSSHIDAYVQMLEEVSDGKENDKVAFQHSICDEAGWDIIDALTWALRPRKYAEVGVPDFDSKGALTDLLTSGYKFAAYDAKALAECWFTVHGMQPPKQADGK